VRVFVLHSSVVIRWFFASSDSDSAVRLLDQRWTYVAPDSLVSEFSHEVEDRVRRGALDRVEAGRLFADLGRVAVETVLCRNLVADAWSISAIAGGPLMDAMYLALAARLNTQVFSADTRFLQRAAAMPMLASLSRDVRKWAVEVAMPASTHEGDITAARSRGA
jgi:predicted nucleic acid-binding protein